MSEEKKSKFTFGNILLVLLVLGTIGVMGLMYVVYNEITTTPERTAAQAQQEQQAASRPVEALTPDGKPLAASARDLSLPPRPQQQTASAPPEPGMDINDTALTDGATPKKPKKPKTPAAETATNTDNGEIQLQPTGTGGNLSGSSSGETRLQPTNNDEPRERRLQPAERKNRSGDAIDELF